MSAKNESNREAEEIFNSSATIKESNLKIYLSCLLIVASILLVYAQVSTSDLINFDDNI